MVTEMEFAACADKKPYFPHLISISLNKPCNSSNLQGLSLCVKSLTTLVNWSVNNIKTEINNKKPSYMALKQDECNATVKVTEKTGIEIVNTELFDVNVCKKEIYKIVN